MTNPAAVRAVRCSFDASGRGFLVTGAAGTIGRVLVRRAASAGATVIAVDRDAEALRGATEGCPGHVIPLVLDLEDPQSIAALADTHGLDEVDVLVNNAAVTTLRDSLLETSVESLDRIHAVNVRATTLLSQYVVRKWQVAGRPGSIVNLSSPGAARAHEDQAAYDASKGAVEALTRAMAVEWGGLGVRVNALAPARVSGDRVAVTDAPLGWSAASDDVADAVLWLASDAAAVVSGQVIALDGGLLARLRTPAATPDRPRDQLVDAMDGEACR